LGSQAVAQATPFTEQLPGPPTPWQPAASVKASAPSAAPTPA